MAGAGADFLVVSVDFLSGSIFFASTFLADDAFFVGFVDFFRNFLVAAPVGADFARVCFFDFIFFLEPAMVAISAPAILADPRHPRDEITGAARIE